MNKSEVLKKVLKLHDLYLKGKIKTLPYHEVNPGFKKSDRLNYLYFTLPVCLNFQRSSPAMWQSALKTWEDPKTNYLFFPEKVVTKSFEVLQKDLFKYKLSLQKNKHTQIWAKICTTLNKFFDNDPRKVLEAGKFDVVKIVDLIQKENKKDFPYLSGEKMTNYWLYILSKYTDVKLKNMNFISIIPDTHVIQCSVKLGLIDKITEPKVVAAAWKNLLDGSPVTPVEMHPVLWNWSRDNFKPKI